MIALASVAVIVVGSIWRFDNAGKVCAGDYLDISSDSEAKNYALLAGTQYSSGRFIKIYLIIVYCLFGLACCCSVVGCVFGKR